MTQPSAGQVTGYQFEDRLAYIGVDVGGTHTDVQVVLDARTARGKALTTYDDFSRGILDAIAVAADILGMTRDRLLGQCQLVVNATTVVTNAITQLKGAKVGVIVTAGFRDEFRFAGGSRTHDFDEQLQLNVPELVPRRDVLEVDERIDYAGNVLVSLNEGQVEEAACRLVERSGVEAIAICFLSSYVNPAHELSAKAIIERSYESVFVTASHSVSARLGETRRWTTALLNCFVHREAHAFLDSVTTQLADAGLAGNVTFFQGLGGGISRERARQFPLALLGAGPAGGAAGANELAKRMGEGNVLVADMGGTSFDTGIIADNRLHIEKGIDLGLFQTALSVVDVVSVGAGGGSLAWISERGVPQVGPRSAGSTPGPAAYGRGGQLPTVTDAMVVLGFIDPSNYLGGRVPLRRDLAERALMTHFAGPSGWDLHEAAVAVLDLVVTNMAHAVREVSVNKGHDPRDFLFLAYGGTLPMFASKIAEMLDIPRVVIPRDSPVFCAFGLLMADYVMRFDQTVDWNLSRVDELSRINEIGQRLADEARQGMRNEGFSDDQISIARTADIQYAGQVHALTVRLREEQFAPNSIPQVIQDFTGVYEDAYGAGTALQAQERLVTYTVTSTGALRKPHVDVVKPLPTRESDMLKGRREVYLPSERRLAMTPIYDDARFTVGSRIVGPAVIEASDTTIFVPGGIVARRDQHYNIVLTGV